MSESKPQWAGANWWIPEPPHEHEVYEAEAADQDLRLVAEIAGPAGMEGEVALLLRAAPDEDAALLKAVEWGERYGEERAMAADIGVGEWEAFAPPWWHEAKAALAKARGEEAPE